MDVSVLLSGAMRELSGLSAYRSMSIYVKGNVPFRDSDSLCSHAVRFVGKASFDP